MTMFRIGIGNDTHRLVAGRPLVLGGVHITADRGGEGHSDADALLHAISDAILGALCEGDLGLHFPDSDPQWKDSNSMQLLSRVVWLAHERGIRIVNVDSTIMLERPQLRPFMLSMRENIAEVLAVEISCVSVKAKTGEGLDAVGQGLAVSAQAVVLVTSG
ncbi:MAG TPA: 2-C-methyl-D-erythritol 2,4-cyclodiphosphate synthase [Blastocatellia bacterium]|nr:2-C-methyl-D-erythritol 2,4-cyclodiphosphate synthase [Blastocatellia bacterium]HCX30167.1 2-C-methyl-D-erythritol 2,4-cyclodiphosphate synthase [Blastocatellia bacterium]